MYYMLHVQFRFACVCIMLCLYTILKCAVVNTKRVAVILETLARYLFRQFDKVFNGLPNNVCALIYDGEYLGSFSPLPNLMPVKVT